MSTLASKPVADAVDVSFTDDELVVTLVDGRRVSAPLEWFPRLLRATSAQRANWSLIGSAIAVAWSAGEPSLIARLNPFDQQGRNSEMAAEVGEFRARIEREILAGAIPAPELN